MALIIQTLILRYLLPILLAVKLIDSEVLFSPTFLICMIRFVFLTFNRHRNLTSLPSHTSANCPLPNFLTLKTVSLVVAYSSDLPRSKAQMSDRGFMHICCSLQHRPSALSVKSQKMICHKTYIYIYKACWLESCFVTENSPSSV